MRAENTFAALTVIGCRDVKQLRSANEIVLFKCEDYFWIWSTTRISNHVVATTFHTIVSCYISVKQFFLIKWIGTIWPCVLIIMIIKGLLLVIYRLFVSLIASFAPSLRSGANDATRATNKLYALQKSCDCPIRANFGIKMVSSGSHWPSEVVCHLCS